MEEEKKKNCIKLGFKVDLQNKNKLEKLLVPEGDHKQCIPLLYFMGGKTEFDMIK